MRSVETSVGIFELLEGGVLFWTVSFGAVLDERTARHAYDAASALASGEPVAIVADARELGFANRRARELLGESQIEGRVATAVIVRGAVIRFLAEQYARRVGETRPFEIFEDEVEAIGWAIDRVRDAGTG